MPTIDELRHELTREAIACLEYGIVKIEHCLGQLDDQQIWWRYHDEMNAIGNLIMHLSGNLRQWIIAGIGDLKDIREREKEFTDRSIVPKEKLIALLTNTVNEAIKTLQDVATAGLLESRLIQGHQVTKMHAMLHSITHYQGHVQEIIHITRAQLASDYKFQWQPKTKAEGAPDALS